MVFHQFGTKYDRREKKKERSTINQKQRQKECQRGIRSIIHPKDDKQRQLMNSIMENDVTVVKGAAGTGKTLLSIYQLYQLLKAGEIDKIYVIRLIAETHEERIGSLPGELKEKLTYYNAPVLDNLAEFLPHGEIEYLVNNDQIEILPVSFCRGRSFNNKGVLIEEAQNLTPQNILTILTRIGKNSKLVFNGDDNQTDIARRSGMHYLDLLVRGIPGADVIEFTHKQIERHPIIPHILRKAESLSFFNC